MCGKEGNLFVFKVVLHMKRCDAALQFELQQSAVQQFGLAFECRCLFIVGPSRRIMGAAWGVVVLNIKQSARTLFLFVFYK
jgi:hypothetical protein